MSNYFQLLYDEVTPNVTLITTNDYDNDMIIFEVRGDKPLLSSDYNILVTQNSVEVTNMVFSFTSNSIIFKIPKLTLDQEVTTINCIVKDLAGNSSNTIESAFEFIHSNSLFTLKILPNQDEYHMILISSDERGDYFNHDYYKTE